MCLLVFLQVDLIPHVANSVSQVLHQKVPIYCPAVCDLSGVIEFASFKHDGRSWIGKIIVDENLWVLLLLLND